MKPFKKQPVKRRGKALSAVVKVAKAEKSDLSGKIETFLDKAELAINIFDYPTAQKFCQKALEIDSDNLRALELSASLLMEVGMTDNAIQCLGRAITLKPDQGYRKYFTMGQLLSGQDAASCFLKGVEIVEGSGENSTEEVKREQSVALCSLAELYMTDLCFEENAESSCENFIKKAIEIDPTNPEAYQAYANFLLVKEMKDLAEEQLEKSMALWFPQFQLIREGKAQGDPIEPCTLGYSARITTAKLLIELEKWDNAVEVLDGLLEEDDECINTWYLLGWLNHLRGDDFKGNARFYLKKALKVNAKNPCDDEEMIKHAEELLSEIGVSGDSEEEDDGDDGNEDFEDVETSDEEMES